MMRNRCVLLLLLLLIPLGFIWTELGTYCQHESGAAANHIGHHNHEHQPSDITEVLSELAKKTGADSDCLSCYAVCPSIPCGAFTISAASSLSVYKADYLVFITSPPSSRFERPRWRALG